MDLPVPRKSAQRNALRKLRAQFPDLDTQVINNVYTESAYYNLSKAKAILANLQAQGAARARSPSPPPAQAQAAQGGAGAGGSGLTCEALQEMFPGVAAGIVQAVFEEVGGNGDRALDALFAMADSGAADAVGPADAAGPAETQAADAAGPAETQASGTHAVSDAADKIRAAYPALDPGIVAVILEDFAGNEAAAIAQLQKMMGPSSESAGPGASVGNTPVVGGAAGGTAGKAGHAQPFQADANATVDDLQAAFPGLDNSLIADVAADYRGDLAAAHEALEQLQMLHALDSGLDNERGDTAIAATVAATEMSSVDQSIVDKLSREFAGVDHIVVKLVTEAADYDLEEARAQLLELCPEPEARTPTSVATPRSTCSTPGRLVVSAFGSDSGSDDDSSDSADSRLWSDSETSDIAEVVRAMFPDLTAGVVRVVCQDAGGSLDEAIDIVLDMMNGTSYSSLARSGAAAPPPVVDEATVTKLAFEFSGVDLALVRTFLESTHGDVEEARASIAAFVGEASPRAADPEYPDLVAPGAQFTTKGTWGAMRAGSAHQVRVSYQGPSIAPAATGHAINGEDMATLLRRRTLHRLLLSTQATADDIDRAFDEADGRSEVALVALGKMYGDVQIIARREAAKVWAAEQEARERAAAKARARAAKARPAAAASSSSGPEIVVRTVKPQPYRRDEFKYLNADWGKGVGASDNPQELIDDARMLARSRNAAFAAAANAYRAGRPALAATLARRGRELDRSMKSVNASRVDKILEQQDVFTQTNHELDLHGLFVSEALDVLDSYLSRHRAKCEDAPCEVIVITGRGKHSARGKAKIRPAVARYLQDSGMAFREHGPGAYRVWAT